MRKISRCLLIATLLLAGAAPAEEALERVNRLRTQAGLPALQPAPALAVAAARHAAYLDRHREPGEQPRGLSAHTEQPDTAGFSGATPQDRAIAAGYPHREVLENLSMGYDDTQRALDGLMAAIYHRLTFLDLAADQLGSAAGKASHVFLLGRSDISGLCTAPPEAARYRPPVDCLGQRMTRKHYEALCAALPDEALFMPPHRVGCTNGVRLDAAFMAALCERPPPAARFRGHGRYYLPCENGTKVDADWFDSLCERRPAGAVYAASGHYYQICEREREVKAEWLEAHCAALPAEALYRDSGRYRRPCADGGDLRVEYLDALDAARQGPLPEVIMWPPPDAAEVPPAFFVEEPDPLPDLEVSGYPLSIQFNPARVERVDLRGFRLFRLEGETRIQLQHVRLLDQDSDPNQRLTAFEFALFPLRRLDWGTHYLAEVEALLDGQPRRYAWSFVTRGRDTPLLTAAGEKQRFVVQPGVDYLLYLPPREDRPHTVLNTRTEHLRGNRVTLTPVDPNTLRVRVQVVRCDRIRLDFDDGRRVELVPAECGG